MDRIQKIHLLLVVVCIGSHVTWTSARAFPEKLSAKQKPPRFANSSAGRSLALPLLDDYNNNNNNNNNEQDGRLAEILAGLRIKASGQTPADTSLLTESRSNDKTLNDKNNPLELLHIKASGQTPADTSLLPRSASGQRDIAQLRRSGPSRVTLVNSEQNLADTSNGLARAGLQTPANVGLLKSPKPAGGAAPQSTSQREQGVQRQETTSFKQLNGENVQVVIGNYGYQSPEGLPVSFKYMSDENGNQASFTIGKAAAGGSNSKAAGAGAGTASGSAISKGAAGGVVNNAANGGTATAGNGDRKYLPPK